MMDAHLSHVTGEKYLAAVVDGAGALALIVPALGGRQTIDDLLAAIDGLLFTGSSSNVEPHRYGGAPSEPGTLHDPQRDATTLPLMRAAIEAGVPVLAICRGFQEMNVVYGGTLHQQVHAVGGFNDHRENKDDPLDTQYGPAHPVVVAADGILQRLLAGAREARVNSLHGQGIDRLGAGLVAEAWSPDGLIEAARVDGARAFALGVQWHPEWQHDQNALSMALFRAFGEACRARMQARIPGGATSATHAEAGRA